ncbi:hypothetical protein Tco_0948407 [Tanacetum coccineum]
MDWLSYYRAVIDCYKKIVRIPLLNDEILEIQGERPEKDPGSLACIKADEKKLDDIQIVRDFSEVFPDDLSGLPPVRELEFRVDLIPGASPVVKSPYRLAPSEMLELSNQLKELQEKGFIRPSHSPWGALVRAAVLTYVSTVSVKFEIALNQTPLLDYDRHERSLLDHLALLSIFQPGQSFLQSFELYLWPFDQAVDT